MIYPCDTCTCMHVWLTDGHFILYTLSENTTLCQLCSFLSGQTYVACDWTLEMKDRCYDVEKAEVCTLFSGVSAHGRLKLTGQKRGWALTHTNHLYQMYVNHRIIETGGRLNGDGRLLEVHRVSTKTYTLPLGELFPYCWQYRGERPFITYHTYGVGLHILCALGPVRRTDV